MARPTVRVLALLELLQSGGVHPVRELAERLDVDERTVRRYVEHLLELGVPVEASRGRHGGYRIGAGSRLPPLMLQDDEAVAVALGLAAAERSGTAGRASASASAKIRRVLPAPLAGRLEALLATTSTAEEASTIPSPSTSVLLAAVEASRDRRPLRIRHRGADGVVLERVVLPWGVVEHEGRWYVAGPDSLRGALRTFRLDRVEHAEPEAGRFDVPAGFDAERQVLTSLARAPWEHEVAVLLHGTEQALRSRLPRGIALLSAVPEGEAPGAAGLVLGEAPPDARWFRARLRVAHLDRLAREIAALDVPFVVERPDALREELAALAARLARRSGSSIPAARGPGMMGPTTISLDEGVDG